MRKNSTGRATSLMACVAVAVFGLLSFAATPTHAQSASGSYQFSGEDGSIKTVEFSARKQADGSTTGGMTFSDEDLIPNIDVDGTGDPSFDERPTGRYLKADFDGLVVEKNRAVMSGFVIDSNVPSYLKQRVLLIVEDNGDKDLLTWGVYVPTEKSWTPSDAELKEDNGWELRWWATDAEREDDKGIPSSHGDEPITVQSFPLSSYDFFDTSRSGGDIQVSE